MEHLVALPQAAQYGDGVLHRGLVHHYRLEAALQGRVLFDVLAVFVDGGRADAMQLAPGQHRLEQVAGVHAALGLAGADDVVQLVDEQDHPALALLDLLEDALQPLLELAAELRAGDQRAHVQGHQLAVLQPGGHVLLDDPLGKALGDGRLADAGLADQHGVVLGLTGQDADDVANLVIAADDRVQLLVQLLRPGLLGQVDAVLEQRVIGVLRVFAGHAGVAPHLLHGLEEGFLRQAKLVEDIANGAVGALDDAQQDVFDRNIFVLHVLGLLLRLGQRGVHGLGDIDLVHLPAGAGNPGNTLDLPVAGGGHALHVDLGLLQDLSSRAVLLVQEGVKQVLLVDLHVLVADGTALRLPDGFNGFLGEFLDVHIATPFQGYLLEQSI